MKEKELRIIFEHKWFILIVVAWIAGGLAGDLGAPLLLTLIYGFCRFMFPKEESK